MSAIDRLRDFATAPQSERLAAIRAYYDRLNSERRARYEARHGEGSVDRDHAALLAEPKPDSLSVAMPRAQDRFGFWEYGR